MRRKNLIVVRKVEKRKLLIKDSKIKKIYTKFKAIIFKKIKKKVLPWRFRVVQIVCVWLILAKCMRLNLKIKYTF